VRLERLRLTNFRQHRDTDLVFGQGLTAIVGPNGAGKSTLLEAIAWAVYGTDAARGNRDSLRWRLAKPRSEVRVELEFVLGAHRYRLVRSLYAAELFLDDAPAPIATSLGEVTERLTRALGMSRDEFFSTYFTGQKELAMMAAMKPAERGQFLARLLGYDKLRLAQDRIRARRNQLRSDLAALEQARPDPEALRVERERLAAQRREAEDANAARLVAFDAAVAAGDAFRPVFQTLSEQRDRHGALLAARGLAGLGLRQGVEAVARIEAEHAEAHGAAAELVELERRLEGYAVLRAELADLDALEGDAKQRSRIEAHLLEVERHRSEVAERLAVATASAALAREAAERIDAARRDQEAAERLLAERQALWVRERQDAESKRQTLLEQYHDLEAQRERVLAAGPDGACPTCGRPLGGGFQGVLDLIASQLEEVRMNGQYFRSRLDQLHKPPPELAEIEEQRRAAGEAVDRANQEFAVAARAAEEALALEKQGRRHEERAAQLLAEAARLRGGYVPERHNAVRASVAALEPVASRAQRLSSLAERAAPLAASLAAAEQRRKELVDALAAVERQLADTAFTEDAFRMAEGEMRRLDKALQDADRDRAAARADLVVASERLAAAEREEAKAIERAAQAVVVQRDFRLHNELDRALGDLRTELNQKMRPDLEQMSGEFLGALTDGRYDEVRLDEEYNLTVLEDGEPQPVISGGEEDLSNLVLRLAVSQMIADRAGQPLELLVLDEIFGSLDETRRLSVLALLRAIETRFPQVVIITHIESVREAADRVLRVRYDEASGSATVAEELVQDAGGGQDAVVAA
jgi:DNA repair protein SbcC/Rad50